MAQTFYILKVKGKAKIPDYIQVRDASFTLIGYFRPQHSKHTNVRGEKNQAKRQLFARIEEAAQDVPYSRITPIELE